MPPLDGEGRLAQAALDQRLTLRDIDEAVRDLLILQHDDGDLARDDRLERLVEQAAKFELLGRRQAAFGARVKELPHAFERVVGPALANLVDIKLIEALASGAILEAIRNLLKLAER